MSPNQQNIEKIIPFLPLFLEEVKDERDEFLAIRRKLNRRIQITILSLIFLILILFFLGSISFLNSGIVLMSFVIGGLMVQQIRYSVIDRKKLTKAFQHVFIEEVHTYITKNIQSSWSYDNAPNFRKKNLLQSQIFHDNVSLENIDFSVTGNFGSIPIDIYKIQLDIGDESQNMTTKNTYIGLFIELYLFEETDNKTVITPRITYQNFNATSFHKLSLHQRGYQQYQDTDLSFNKYFKVYNMEGYDLPASLTMVRQRQLAHFIQYHKKQLYLSFQENKLHIAIRTDEPTLLPTLHNDNISTKEATQNFYQDLQLCLDLLQRLQLAEHK